MKTKKCSGKSQRSWAEKLDDAKGLPKTIVVPAPREVDALMRAVPRGSVVTIETLCAELARRHGTTHACPMTTGIFAWIAAHAAEEARAAGAAEFTPYWRTLKTGGILNPKYPGGIAGQRRLLAAEGHRVVRRKGAWVVAGLEQPSAP
jgi:alkylated DNA nucleotide flippase Atl1